MNEEQVLEYEDDYDEMSHPPMVEAPFDHPHWKKIRCALMEVYDPEIPVNIYELGLIYIVEIKDNPDSTCDLDVKMSLTSPGCPVAQEMPSMVQSALFPLECVTNVDVEVIWDPPWDPSRMSETARFELNMFT